MDSIVIRRLSTLQECGAMEAIQREVWGRDLTIAGPHLFASIKVGGIAVGAYDGCKPIGFCYGFPARKEAKNMWFHSHMLAVLPAYQGRQIAYRLKVAQRQEVLDEGHTLVTWTLDPLLVIDGHLNLTRLGAVAGAYLEDYYGKMDDPLNRGLPTDRLLTTWHLTSERVVERLAGRGVPVSPPPGSQSVNQVDFIRTGLPVSSAPDLSLTARQLLVHCPDDFQAVRSREPLLARDWRLKTRAAFSHYLGRGYRVVEVFTGEGAACYLLEE